MLSFNVKIGLVPIRRDVTARPGAFNWESLWGKFNNLSNVERKLIEGPYIHHMSEIEGDLTEHIREFCKYVPGLRYDDVE